MLDIGKDNRPDPKCFFTHVQLPQKIEGDTPSAKKKPFSCVNQLHHNHAVDIIVPQSIGKVTCSRLSNTLAGARYARVHLKLKDVLEHDFFNNYIKTGNISLVSDGQPGVENTYELHDGVLRLALDRTTYERAGLSGKPIPSPGRKHQKSRYIVELDLRLPSMVRGRPLFNRMVHAFNHALTETRTFLFFDHRDRKLNFSSPVPPMKPAPSAPSSDAKDRGDGDTPPGLDESKPAAASDGRPGSSSVPAENPPSRPPASPLTQHHPVILPLEPQLAHLDAQKTPAAIPSAHAFAQDGGRVEAADLLEWLSLVMLSCPRLDAGDACDGALCRYRTPDLAAVVVVVRRSASSGEEEGVGGEGGGSRDDEDGQDDHGAVVGSQTRVEDLSSIKLRGYLPSALIMKLLVSVIRTSASDKTWVAFRIQSLRQDKCMILIKDGSAMVWEYA